MDVPPEIAHLQFAQDQIDSDSDGSAQDVQSQNSRREFREVDEGCDNDNGQVIGPQMQVLVA